MLAVIVVVSFPLFSQPAPYGSSIQGNSTPDESFIRILQLNQEIANAVAKQPADAARIGDLVRRRAALVENQISAYPQTFPEWMLQPELAARLRSVLPGAPIESKGTWAGAIEASIADDFQHSRSWSSWFLNTGHERLELSFGTHPPPRSGARVVVTGVRLANRLGAVVIGPDALPQTPGSPEYNNPLGPQHVAVFLVTTPSNPSFPAGMDKSFFEDKFFSSNSGGSISTASLNDFVFQASYGNASVTGQVFGPFALTEDFSCADVGQVLGAVVSAAGTTVDFGQFNRAFYVFPAKTCSFGGYASIGTEGSVNNSYASYSESYIPILPNYPSDPLFLITVLAHEFGHNLGLNHASSADYGSSALGAIGAFGTVVEYGDPFSMMGNGIESGGKTAAAGQYSAYHKAFLLNWLGPSDFVEMKSSGSVDLQPFETGSGTRAVRILRDPQTQTWLWLEYRQAIGSVDSSFSSLETGGQSNVLGGALVHYEDPARDETHSFLLTMNPVVAPNSFLKAALTPGTTWRDPFSLLALSVSSPTSAGLTVNVSYDQPCAALNASATSFSASAGAGVVTVTAPASCSWTVSNSSSWITIASPLSGSGNGTVQFSLSANSGGLDRSGYITIQRQSVTIQQTGAVVSISMTPASGQGTSATFMFRVSDTNGFADVTGVEVSFFGDPGCTFGIGLAKGGATVNLFTHGGLFWGDLASSGSLNLLSPGSPVTNGACTISPKGASATRSGNDYQLTIPVTFLFGSGTYRVMAVISSPSVSPLSGSQHIAWNPLGTWSPTTATPSISAAGIVNAATYATSIAPGALAALFGSNLATQASQAASLPLPRQLGSVSITVNGTLSPLLFISPSQINFQVPAGTPVNTPVSVVVTNNGVPSSPASLTFLPNAPGIFGLSGAVDTTTSPAVFHALTGLPVTPLSPATAGEFLVLAATGAAIDDPPPDGTAAPVSPPLAVTTARPTVSLQGTKTSSSATALFSGLAPGFVGELQVNIQLPAMLPDNAGSLGLRLTYAGASSQEVNLYVH
jgi:uncharacterized protein (TIGR03437 family)